MSTLLNTSPPADLVQLFEPIREDLASVEAAYMTHIASAIDPLPEMARYIQGSGGKRVRPALLLMASRLCGYQGEWAVTYASVVEFIHTATLVHDDIIDDSGVRRGRLAVHSRWGNDITVLLGDYLYITSMKMALTYHSIDVVRLLCDVTRRMIEGEFYQLTKAGDVGITEAEYFDIIERKTAFLFGGSAEIGARLADATPEQCAALREYGFNLGVAFQLVDDLLDFTADHVALGKPVGGDLRDGKLTLPAIRLLELEGEGSRADAIVRSAVDTRSIDDASWAELTALLRARGTIDYACDRAVAYATAAKDALGVFAPSPERDALAALPDFVLARDH